MKDTQACGVPRSEREQERWSVANMLARVSRGGIRCTLRRAWEKYRTARWESYLNVNTRGSLDRSELDLDAGSFGYQPIPLSSLEEALRCIEFVPDEDVFLDYGCGKGRALLLAGQMPFRRILGVERSSELCAVAEENVERARSKLTCQVVDVICTDARQFAPPPDVTVAFLFNPFDEEVLSVVLSRLAASVAEWPRRFSIIYSLPKCRRDLLAETPWLVKQRALETVHSDWQRLTVYRAVI